MEVTERQLEIAPAITAYEEAKALVDVKKQESLEELMRMMHPLSNVIREHLRLRGSLLRPSRRSIPGESGTCSTASSM